MMRLLAALVTPNELPIPRVDVTKSTVANVLQVVFGFAGGIALLMVTRAAFKYVISQGEPQEVKKAKDAILFALAGLAVSILAFSIVQFVIDRVK